MADQAPQTSPPPVPWSVTDAHARAVQAQELESVLGNAHLALVLGQPFPSDPHLDRVVMGPLESGNLDPLRSLAPFMTPAGRRTLVEMLAEHPVCQGSPQMLLRMARVVLIEHPTTELCALGVLEHAARLGNADLFNLVHPLVSEPAILQSFQLTAALLSGTDPFSESTYTFLDGMAAAVPLDELRHSIPSHHLARLPHAQALLTAAGLAEGLPPSVPVPAVVHRRI